jgi:FAD synthase
MDCNTADLGTYIESCHNTYSFCRDGVFDQGITHLRPRLESNRTNRVLLYPGSFNPPHRGHEALLNRAFACSHDINAIAAIILPLDDSRVEAKCRHLGHDLIFTKEQRVQLWKGYGMHDWRWVYNRSEQE